MTKKTSLSKPTAPALKDELEAPVVQHPRQGEGSATSSESDERVRQAEAAQQQ